MYKWIGGALIIASCGGFGFSLAAAQRREEAMLRQLISTLDLMECELQYRLTPLPELCKQAARDAGGTVGRVFGKLGEELEAQVAPDVDRCMGPVLSAFPELPGSVREGFSLLGRSLGRFDLEGQLKGLENVRAQCRRNLEKLTENREPRLRSIQTLGVCAGAALAILFI